MLTKIVQTLKTQQNVGIVTHVNPDGDALGSAFALKFALNQLNVDAEVVLCEPIPHSFEFTGWIPLVYNENLKFPCVIGVDFGDISRCGICAGLFDKADVKMIVDHHIVQQIPCELFFSSPDDGACGQIIYRMLKMLEITIDKPIAETLYTAIMTDTGGCRFGNTTSETHLILAELIKSVDVAFWCRMLFDIITPRKLEIRNELFKTLETFADGKICAMTATADLSREDDLLGGMVNNALNIEGAKAGVLFKEKGENEVKVSLRTADGINAMQICSIFGGGGHFAASGCTINEPLAKAKEMFIKELISAI